MKMIVVAALFALPLFANEEFDTLTITGAAATELSSNLHARDNGLQSGEDENILSSTDGELHFGCSAEACYLSTHSRILAYEDNADGTPFSVQQISLFGVTARELTESLRNNPSVDPLPTITGGSDPIVEIRVFLSSDQKLFIQCEKRRHTNHCVVRKFTF